MIKYVMLMGLMLLTACGTRSLQITSAPAQIAVTQAVDPEPVTMLPVNLNVVTPENMDEFITQLRNNQSTQNTVFVGITIRDYENLSLNLAELRRYIEQQQAVITFYRRMSVPTN